MVYLKKLGCLALVYASIAVAASIVFFCVYEFVAIIVFAVQFERHHHG
jgi:hypothetical protein